MKRIRAFAIVLFVLAYPFLSAYWVRQGWSAAVLLLFAGVCAWRGFKASQKAFRLSYAAAALLLALGALFAGDAAARLIPSMVYALLAGLFGYTLNAPPSLCERLVRLQFPEFQPGIAEYLVQLTWVWAGFFAVNAIVCAALALMASEEAWTLYTGLAVYLLMGVLAVGEFLYRPFRFPDLEIPGPLATFRAIAAQAPRVFRDVER